MAKHVPNKRGFYAYEEESVQKRAADNYAKRQGQQSPVRDRFCRHCGTQLMSGTEWRLGIHVWCVHTINQRVAAATIPSPRYGRS